MTEKIRGTAGSLMRKQVEGSGLLPRHARRMGWEAVTAKQLQRRCGELPAYERAMIIPYLDERGKPTGFWRARYLAQPKPLVNGHDPFAAKSGPPEWTADLRYVQPRNTLSELYLPPFVDWPAIMRDVETPLTITEGEKKAAKACVEGIPCVGLGGVWMWKSGRMKHPLLPQFYSFAWSGRTVYLIYDSDANTNPDVHRAANELAKHLTGLGAIPRIVFLPHVLPTLGGKTGLDDYLMESGAPALGQLLNEAEAYHPAAALYELNAKVAYVKNPGIIVELDTGRKLSASAFKEHAYANFHYVEEKKTKENQPAQQIRKPAAPAWLGWEHRYELERITYQPGTATITPAREYNEWEGWGVKPKRGDVSLWRELLDHLFRGGAQYRRWFEQWLACPLQKPGIKMYTACMLWGVDQGTGKSLIGYSMGRIYGKNFSEIKKKQLFSSHNEWAQNKQFILADEITSGRRDAKVADIADELKNMITSLIVRINPKYVPSYEIPDVMNYYFTSNHPDAMFLEDKDRRFFIWHVNAAPLSKEWYRKYNDWYKSEEGAAALFWHLLHLDLKDFDPLAGAPMTEAKKQMMEASLSDLGAWVRKLRDEPDHVLRMDDAPLAGDLWTNEELLHLYDPERKRGVTANGMGRELTRAGILQAAGGRPIRTPYGQHRLYAARNGKQWAAAPQRVAGKHYSESRGVEKHSRKDKLA